jgi:hypothetical protein
MEAEEEAWKQNLIEALVEINKLWQQAGSTDLTTAGQIYQK